MRWPASSSFRLLAPIAWLLTAASVGAQVPPDAYRVEDVATVRDGFEEEPILGRFNGRRRFGGALRLHE